MNYQLLQGDCIEVLKTLPAASVHCVVTSPPYYSLRDYQVKGQIGLEPTPSEYVAKLVEVFRQVWRVLRDDGSVWLNLGDSYAANRSYQVPDQKWGDVGNSMGFRVPEGLKSKDLIGIPWRVAFALQADGWWLRGDIIWHKPNPMPESVTDRPTKAHEYLFLLAKRERYFYDAQAIKEASIYPDDDRKARSTVNQKRMPTESIAGVRPGSATYATRNKRSVWTIATKPYTEAHFATYPVELIQPCIKAGTSAHGCCSACGAPWVRVVERTDEIDQSAKGSRFDKGKTGVNGNGRVQEGDRYVKRSTGWQPSCTCGADVVPCTVLDPFNGAATTGVAAIGLGRQYIGIDLNPEYIAMSDRRLRNTQPALLGIAP